MTRSENHALHVDPHDMVNSVVGAQADEVRRRLVSTVLRFPMATERIQFLALGSGDFSGTARSIYAGEAGVWKQLEALWLENFDTTHLFSNTRLDIIFPSLVNIHLYGSKSTFSSCRRFIDNLMAKIRAGLFDLSQK